MQDEPTLWRLKFFVKDALENAKKKEETIRTKQNNEVSNKRNAVNKLTERRTKRTCL